MKARIGEGFANNYIVVYSLENFELVGDFNWKRY